MQMKQPGNALAAYEEVLKKSPNRFNALYGAGLAAEKSGNPDKAILYYKQLIAVTAGANSDRPELGAAKLFLLKH